MSKRKPRNPVVVLNPPPQPAKAVVFAQGIHDALETSSSFPDLPLALNFFQDHINAFAKAEAKVGSGVKGAAAERDAAQQQVMDDLSLYRTHVQNTAGKSPNLATAMAIIESASMSVRKPSSRSTPEIRAQNGAVSGEVLLMAKAVATVATYFWEHSLDQSNWSVVPPTMYTKSVLSGLASKTLHYFRFRALVGSTLGDYSQVVSLWVQ